MSDYNETFTKGTGDTIAAADFETEFSAIETAIATKFDADFSGYVGGSVTSGTSVTPSTGTETFGSIPSWVKKITVNLHNVSITASDTVRLRIGDSGGIETSGYTTGYSWITEAAAADTVASSAGGGFTFAGYISGAGVISGTLTLSLVDSTNNVWAMSGNTVLVDTTDYMHHAAGSKALSATLTQIDLDISGAATFDAGTVNILYEG